MSTVYVLNKDGKPLMPTTRGGHVRHLLKEQKARVVRAKPFTIQLLYETNDVVQPLYLGIDPGRTNIGVAVVKANGTAVFTAHLETRNKEVPKLIFLVGKHVHIMQGIAGSKDGKATTYKDSNANSITASKCKFVAKNSGILFV